MASDKLHRKTDSTLTLRHKIVVCYFMGWFGDTVIHSLIHSFKTCFPNCLSCLHTRYLQQLDVVSIHPSLALLAVITSHVLLPRRTFQNLRYRFSFLLGLMTREDWTDTLSRNVGTTRRRVIPQKTTDFINIAAEVLKSSLPVCLVSSRAVNSFPTSTQFNQSDQPI